MPYYFACPHCGEQTLVEDQYAGLRGPCINCGKTVQIPQFARAAVSSGPSMVAAGRGANWFPPLLKALAGLAAVAAVIVGIVALGAPAWKSIRARQYRTHCADNLRQIGLALQAYENDFHGLPPAFTRDASGKPMHSWRVLILPYLGAVEKKLHARYDFSKPWNDPYNSMVLREMPAVFASPADPNSLSAKETNYMVVVGKNTMFPGATSRSRSDVTDLWDSTILVVEVKSRGIAWTEPKDLAFQSLNFSVNDGTNRSLGGDHESGANVLLGSYKTRFLLNESPPDLVSGLLTIDGGENTEILDEASE